MINEKSGGTAPGGRPGFSVTTDELTRYVRHTRDLADDLHRLAGHTVGPVRSIAEDSFGGIGRETGFAAALKNFGEALEHQVAGVARNADRLSDGVAKTARNYRQQDQELANDILELIDKGR